MNPSQKSPQSPWSVNSGVAARRTLSAAEAGSNAFHASPVNDAADAAIGSASAMENRASTNLFMGNISGSCVAFMPES